MLLTDTLFMCDHHAPVLATSSFVFPETFGSELVILQHAIVVVEAEEPADSQ